MLSRFQSIQNTTINAHLLLYLFLARFVRRIKSMLDYQIPQQILPRRLHITFVLLSAALIEKYNNNCLSALYESSSNAAAYLIGPCFIEITVPFTVLLWRRALIISM